MTKTKPEKVRNIMISRYKEHVRARKLIDKRETEDGKIEIVFEGVTLRMNKSEWAICQSLKLEHL